MKKQLVVTQDGSHSLYLPELDEHYHSIHGSIRESEHIFIQSGFCELAKTEQDIRILEIGMGTGLNLLKTMLKSEGTESKIAYTGVEAYPVSWEESMQLNYPALLEASQAAGYFEQIHQCPWEESIFLKPNFEMQKCAVKWEDFETEKRFNLVYFDAFAPEKQAEMWTDEVFAKLTNFLEPNAILVSYCVKGEVRRRLQSLGFAIEKLAGPSGGKREILRARYKPEEA